jgi:hypothetical protein
MSTAPVIQTFGPCRCWHPECSELGTKLMRPLKGDRVGHLVSCQCPRHRNAANRRRGAQAEQRRHEGLGGTGKAPVDELRTSYSINVTTQDKAGAQVPASFEAFVGSVWFGKALRQAEAKMAIGFDALPAVYVEPPSGGRWLVVKVPARGLR